jgi:pantoate--beta-alanine ligase
MERIESRLDLKHRIDYLKSTGKVVGLVPTMGSLHDGHLSLIKIAKEHCDVVVCSIYINPTQFNDQKDFEKYPNNLSNDLKLLEIASCDIAFTPIVEEIYPEGIKNVEYEIGSIGDVMEGKFRKGHFNGVIQVVKRLFDLVNPDVAVFGMKDFQQLAIINWMIVFFKYEIKIIGAPIFRERDGLAMSSRNIRLNSEEREIAVNLSKTLFYIRDNYKKYPLLELINRAKEKLEAVDKLTIEYLEIVDTNSLQRIDEIESAQSAGIFIAAKAGEVRLIDNVVLF